MKMKIFMFFILAFGSKESETVADDTSCGEFGKINAENPIMVKIEEDEYVNVNNRCSSKYIGVSYDKNHSKWKVQRWSKNEKKSILNGSYDDEETAAQASDTLARNLMKNNEQKLKLNFPDDDTEVYKEKSSSEYIGVTYRKLDLKWSAYRLSKNENKVLTNGSYDTEEEAAHASDTLARKLMQNGEQGLKLNFPYDDTEMHKKKRSSQYIGVTYKKCRLKWEAQRWSKNENKTFYNGSYDNEEAAAYASDALARNLMKNSEQKFKLNFPDDDTEVYKKKCSSECIGVTHTKHYSKWKAYRHAKNENKTFYSGYYDTEEEAAHASDTLARKLMQNGEQGHKLNFPHDDIEVHKKRNSSQYVGVTCRKFGLKWEAQRWSKNENKTFYNGSYDNEEAAAYASDTLARKLMENSELKLKLNFADDKTQHQKKRKRSGDLGNLQDN